VAPRRNTICFEVRDQEVFNIIEKELSSRLLRQEVFNLIAKSLANRLKQEPFMNTYRKLKEGSIGVR